MNGTQGGREIGAHGSDESNPCEGEFFQRGKCHSTDDWKQREIRLPRRERAKHHRRKRGGDDRLGCLDNMCERNSTSPQRDDGSNVCAEMAKRNGNERLDVVHGEFRCFTKPCYPEREAVRDANKQLQCSHCVWNGQCVERLLVIDVVSNVEEVPEGEEAASNQRLDHRRSTIRCRLRGL